MQQMLIHYGTDDFARFKTAFDADSEDRGRNGLSLLQLWRAHSGGVWALFQVSDAVKAQAYLAGAAGVFNSQAGVTSVQTHLLDTL